MISDELEALVLADAIGALDPDERLELQARLDGLTAEERSEIAGLYDVTTAMAASAPSVTPPAHVRQRLLAAARKPARYTAWAAEAEWIETGVAGIRARILVVDTARSLVTMVLRAEPAAV